MISSCKAPSQARQIPSFLSKRLYVVLTVLLCNVLLFSASISDNDSIDADSDDYSLPVPLARSDSTDKTIEFFETYSAVPNYTHQKLVTDVDENGKVCIMKDQPELALALKNMVNNPPPIEPGIEFKALVLIGDAELRTTAPPSPEIDGHACRLAKRLAALLSTLNMVSIGSLTLEEFDICKQPAIPPKHSIQIYSHLIFKHVSYLFIQWFGTSTDLSISDPGLAITLDSCFNMTDLECLNSLTMIELSHILIRNIPGASERLTTCEIVRNNMVTNSITHETD
ncbi:hypothetical protein NEDG_01579 [Nematocida displodere]|uniref:Uncharacterized protein n=1 Tax=Nematocida displodere TaxID=1805483 RepID=A0A177EHI1_9MICR|nr:hypothetical protein NEDG_01579 [Nematocida displodere]